MLDLVRRVRWRRRILTLAVVDRLLSGISLVAVMSYRPSCHRSSNESSTSCPSSHPHGGLPSVSRLTRISRSTCILTVGIGCVKHESSRTSALIFPSSSSPSKRLAQSAARRLRTTDATPQRRHPIPKGRCLRRKASRPLSVTGADSSDVSLQCRTRRRAVGSLGSGNDHGGESPSSCLADLPSPRDRAKQT